MNDILGIRLQCFSVADTYRNVCTSLSDFKELIPEFYESDGKFLLNYFSLDLGLKQNGRPVGDVELPPWASSRGSFYIEDF